MKNMHVNDVIEMITHDEGVYEIRVKPFSKGDIGLYEDGIRKALMGKDAAGEITLFMDFSDENIIRELDDRALFDVFQFISFKCLRYKKVFIKWSAAMLSYLVNYAQRKDLTWKMSLTTVNKLISIRYDPEYTGKF